MPLRGTVVLGATAVLIGAVAACSTPGPVPDVTEGAECMELGHRCSGGDLWVCGWDDRWERVYPCSTEGLLCSVDPEPGCLTGSADRQVLTAELERRWVGNYPDTAGFLDSEPLMPPSADAAPDGATIHWPTVVYEDCREPDAFIVRRAGTAIDLELVDWWGTVACFDNDYVSAASVHLVLEPGTYTIALHTDVGGFWVGTPPVDSFTVVVP